MLNEKLEHEVAMASDLKVLAVLRGEMCPDYSEQRPFKARATPFPHMLHAF
jgi:hypothetical protein